MFDKSKNLKVKDVAERLDVREAKIYKLINSGALPAINLSSGTVRPNWVVNVDDLDKFIASRKTN